MGIFKKIFGGKSEDTSTLRASSPQGVPTKEVTISPSSDPSKDPNLIEVYDAYGRQVFIPREEWRTKVLPASIEANWQKPDELYGIILGALNGGFRSSIVEAAEHLQEIDPQPVRGAAIWGVVLIEEGKLDEAEGVFRTFLSTHGEHAIILTNLAKVHLKRHDQKEAEALLWRALELEPNQDHALGWYVSLLKDRDGEEASFEGLKRAARLPGSWRAALWLARKALQGGALDAALDLYRESLDGAPKPVPSDLLMQMSGDLGNAGQTRHLIDLTEPQFDLPAHGLMVGNNLIKAHLTLGELDAARKILDGLYALNRPDWKSTLGYWDTEIARARVAASPAEQTDLRMTILSVDGPIWSTAGTPFYQLLVPSKDPRHVISFLGASVELAKRSTGVERQMADRPGRLSRSLPLHFTERLELETTARARTLIPWITNGGGGFLLSGAEWKDSDVISYAQSETSKSDVAVGIHLKALDDRWQLSIRALNTSSGECIGALSTIIADENDDVAIAEIGDRLVRLFLEAGTVEKLQRAAYYKPPAGPQFGNYLLRLEQLLAVRCSGMDGVPRSFLNGEREILDGNLMLCLGSPDNPTTRIVFAQTVLAMKSVRPDVVFEFRDKIEKLQREQTIPGPAGKIIQEIFDAALRPNA